MTDSRPAWAPGLICRILLGGICLLAVWDTLHRPTVLSLLTDAQIRAISQGSCPGLRQHPDIFGCLPGPSEVLLITARPALLPTAAGEIWVRNKPPPPHLPAPPGVIVVRGETPDPRPDLSECPPGYTEARRYRWRFCLAKDGPHHMPTDIMNPPIAGIPYPEAAAIFRRHNNFMDMPGVVSVGLYADGLVVQTTQPEEARSLIPSSIEGLPVRIERPTGKPSMLFRRKGNPSGRWSIDRVGR